MRYALAGTQQGSAARTGRLGRTRGETWFLVGCLALVAVGIVLSVALMQYHYAFAGERTPSGWIQGIVVSIYGTFGFVACLYLCLLLILWGSVAFVTGRVRDPLRRIAASFVFSFCLALLTAAMGGDGGTFGESVAGRLQNAFGGILVFLLLSVMTLTAVLLATDWFFFRTFARMTRGRDRSALGGLGRVELDQVRETGVEPREEDRLAIAAEEVVAEHAEVLVEEDPYGSGRLNRLGLVPQPVAPARAKAASPSRAVSPAARAQEESNADDRRREHELMDRVLEEARRDLLDVNSAGLDVATGTTVTAEPAEESAVENMADASFQELEDEDLLAAAGAALERAWSGDADDVQGILPVPQTTEAADAEADDEAGHAETEATTPESEASDVLDAAGRESSADLFAARPDVGGVDDASQDRDDVEVESDLEETYVVDLDEGLSDELTEELAGDLAEEPTEPDVVLEPMPPQEPRVDVVGIDEPAPQKPPVQEHLFAEEPPDPDLLDRAARVILTARRPMQSLLQRQLDLTFAEARQTLDYLAKLGVVEAPDGSGPWQPLIDLREWEDRRA